MVTGKTKILRHIWEQGGGHISKFGNVYLVTKIALADVGIQVNVGNVTIEKTVHKGVNVAMLKGISVTRGKGYLYKILTGVCVDNRFYVPVDRTFNTVRLANGSLIDTYCFAMIEHYIDVDKTNNKNI